MNKYINVGIQERRKHGGMREYGKNPVASEWSETSVLTAILNMFLPWLCLLKGPDPVILQKQ